jgi:hypothetical protein
MNLVAQTHEIEPDALRIAENVPWSANMKTRPDALGTTENDSGRANHENGTRHPPYRRKLVWERKI